MDDLPSVMEIYNHDLSKVSKVALADYLTHQKLGKWPKPLVQS